MKYEIEGIDLESYATTSFIFIGVATLCSVNSDQLPWSLDSSVGIATGYRLDN
jgi:hypothetical protein